MKVVVILNCPGNQPEGVDVCLPDWGLGGTRQRITMSLWEALELRAALNKVLP